MLALTVMGFIVVMELPDLSVDIVLADTSSSEGAATDPDSAGEVNPCSRKHLQRL